MCGFAGILYGQGQFEARRANAALASMSRALEFRGPDAEGKWIDEKQGVALLHRRLSILDLSPSGAQPMISRDERFVILLNGEIYNFPDIRQELELADIKFRGTSDTEVLLEGISLWGIERTLKKAVGMFALAIWDRYAKTLTIARDRVGEKPLVYGWVGPNFVFASTLNAIESLDGFEQEIDNRALGEYLRWKYIPAPLTIYKSVRKLLPGSIVTIRQEDLMRQIWPDPVPYWSLLEAASGNIGKIDDAAAIEETRRLLGQSVRGCMLSDVPIGAFLSGGIDSSAVVALMQSQSTRPVRTFTIGFEDKAYNEAPYAKAISKHLGTDHTEVILTEKDALQMIPEIPRIFHEPFADSSQIPTALVSKIARQQVTVSLSGDGGDEIFCGYNRQVELLRQYKRMKSFPMPLRKMASNILKAIPTSVFESILRGKGTGLMGDQVEKYANILPLESVEQMYLTLAQVWPNPAEVMGQWEANTTALHHRNNWPGGVDVLKRLLWVEASTSLPGDMLVKVDRAAMAFSLEGRMPLLDHRLIEFAWSLPDEFRIRNGASKWVLRQVLFEMVPRELIERPKAGFGVPVDRWLGTELREWAEDLLAPSKLEAHGLNPEPICAVWRDHLSGRKKGQSKIWTVLMYMQWVQDRAGKRLLMREATEI